MYEKFLRDSFCFVERRRIVLQATQADRDQRVALHYVKYHDARRETAGRAAGGQSFITKS